MQRHRVWSHGEATEAEELLGRVNRFFKLGYHAEDVELLRSDVKDFVDDVDRRIAGGK